MIKILFKLSQNMSGKYKDYNKKLKIKITFKYEL